MTDSSPQVVWCGCYWEWLILKVCHGWPSHSWHGPMAQPGRWATQSATYGSMIGLNASQPLSVHSQQALLAVSSAHHAGLHPCLDGVLLVVNCTIFVLMFTWLVYSSTTLFHPHCLSRANSCLRTIKEHVFGSAKDRTHSPTYARQNLYYWATSPPARRRYIVYYWCKVDRNSN